MQQILDLLSPHEFQLKLRSLVQQRIPGTGHWPLENPEFLQWENGKSTKILWCKGEGNHLKSLLVAEFLKLAPAKPYSRKYS